MIKKNLNMHFYMEAKKIKVCIVFTLLLMFISGKGFAQHSPSTSIEKSKKFKLISPLDLHFKLPETNITNSIKQPSIFHADKLPLFCKFEHKLSKSSKVNLRMRLGSLDYVNKLEGKN